MEIRKKIIAHKKKIISVLFALCAISLALLLPTHAAHADPTSFLVQASAGVIGWIVYVLLLIANTIGGVAIALITYLTGIILQLSNNVVNTFTVQTGFSITLAVANLGFVLAIIIIALATILHQETYGIKKSLWKLIVAAIMVNFSLVIGAAFINFANIFTNAFFAQLPGGGSGVGPIDFATQLAGAFSPQRAFISAAFGAGAPGGGGGNGNILSSIATAIGGPVAGLVTSVTTGGTSGQDLASVITPLISLACGLGFLIVIVITLAVFLFMVVVRYVALAALLILMPLAWLMWLFPKTAHLWSRWWSQFIRWTFFAPIVVFFLWLAIATANTLNCGGGAAGCNATQGDLAFVTQGNYQTQITGIMAPVAEAVGSFIGTFAITLLNGIVVIGLAMGGMIVADKMSIMGASAGISAARSVGEAGKRFASQRSRQIVTSPLRSEGAKNLASRMQQRSANPLMRFTGVDYLRRQAGVALQGGTIAAGEKMVEESKDQYKGLTAEQKLNKLSTARGPYGRIALLEGISADKNLSKLSGPELQQYLGKDKEAEFKRYGKEKVFKKLREESGLELKDTEKNIEEMRTAGKAEDEIQKEEAKKDRLLASYIESNMDAVSEGFGDPKDLAKRVEKAKETGRVPFALDEKSLIPLQKSIVRGIASGLSSDNVASLMRSIAKKNNLKGFKEAVAAARAGIGATEFNEIQNDLRNNKQMLKWNDREVGRGVLDMDLRELYGIEPAAAETNNAPAATPAPQAQPTVIGVEEVRNVKEGPVSFDDQGRPKNQQGEKTS